MQGAVSVGDFRSNNNAVRSGMEDRAAEILARIEQNLNDLAQGLSLLGVKRCSHCKRFFRSSNPGALFANVGELVCFECIPAWWPARREQLVCAERQKAEGNLVYWLRTFHNARSFKGSGKPGGKQPIKFEIVASCHECRGTGTHMGDRRCRFCDGPGSVRVIVPQAS